MAGTNRGGRGLFAVIAIAAVLRVHDLGLGDVWVDEANGILTARRSLSEMAFRLRFDSSPPLYYALLHAWIGVVGLSQEALRLLSVGFGVALCGAAFAAGRRLLSRDAGLWAAFAVATSPAHVFHSQQVRMYTLLGLLALLSVAFLVRWLREERTRDLVAFTAATIAALYTHNFAFHLGVVDACLILVSGKLPRLLPRLAASGAAIAACYAPWIPTLLAQVANEDHYAWYLPLWSQYGLSGAVWRSVLSFSPAGEFVMYEYLDAPSFRGVPAALGAAAAAFGAVRLWRRRGSLGRVAAVAPTVLLLVPIASALALSSFLTPHYVPGRVDQLVYPAYALLLGAGLSALPLPWARTALAAAMLALAVVMKSAYYTDYRTRGFDGTDRALASDVAAELADGDVIVCTGLTRASLEYYLVRWGFDVPILNFPRETALHLGAQNDWRLIADPAGLRREAGEVVRRVEQIAGPDGRLFVLRTNLHTNDYLAPQPLRDRFGIERERRIGRYVQAGTEERVMLTLNRLPAGAR